MRSKLFKDMTEPESIYDRCAPDQLCVCVRLPKEAYARLLAEAARQGETSGAYLGRLIDTALTSTSPKA